MYVICVWVLGGMVVGLNVVWCCWLVCMVNGVSLKVCRIVNWVGKCKLIVLYGVGFGGFDKEC